MFRRIVMPAVALAALAAMLFVVLPAGAIGNEHASTRSGAADRYAFGRDIDVTAPVVGSVQAYGGSVTIEDVIEGDLLVFGGDATFRGRGRVTGNVIIGGGRIIDGDGRIGGRIYPLTTLEGAAASMTKTAVLLSLLFVWFIAAIVVTIASGREVRYSSIEIRASALHCFTLGLVAMTSFVLTALVFSYLVPYLIGIPLLAALAVFAILTKIYGLIAVFHAVGSLVAAPKTRDELQSRKWFRGDVAMVIAGLLILGLVRLIPVVGTVVWSIASVFGIGVALATKFGRREPWFLAWRPIEA